MVSELTIYLPIQIEDLALELKLQVEAQKLVSLVISDAFSTGTCSGVVPVKFTNENKINGVENILLQLNNYFSSATPFQNIVLEPGGTQFQKSVWNELCNIPVGETRTYGEIANKLNSSARAVGNACRKNPIQLIVPCHRVISAKGLGGYAGQTEGRQLSIKRWLLNHEGIVI